MAQRFGLGISTAGNKGSIPGQGTKILYAVWHGPRKNKIQIKK